MDIRPKTAPGARVRTARLKVVSGYRFDTAVDSGHVVPTDEGTHLGGTGAAPTSLETLTAALASCQSVQVVRVAEAMRFRMANFGVACVTTSGKQPGVKGNAAVTRIDGAHIEIAFDTDETPARLERLKVLAVDKCPIGRLFDEAGIPPRITWKVGALARQE
jgi:uncharacterized OsmC-like protein